MTSLIENADAWERRSEEAHDMAAVIADPDIKSTLLRIAAGYARMAARARQQETSRTDAPQPLCMEQAVGT
jgi:hypothetical protein